MIEGSNVFDQKVLVCCVYGIVDYSAQELKIPPLYPVVYRDIAAVVGTSCKERLKFDRQAAIEYGHTLEVLHRDFTLIPCRFGTFLQNEHTVSRVLREHYCVYKKKLEEVKDRHEFGLKIMSEKKAQRSNVSNERRWESGKEYLMQKFYDYRTHIEAGQDAKKATDVIHGELQRLSNMSLKDTKVNGNVVFSCNYLVEKRRKSLFCSKVQALQGMYPELRFLLTGPWPPYNFVAGN
ncbi:MAG: GvpL/GvpF family gas vesicle protein [Chlorobiales bacterium]|nr:GvpL/GvpF family gas vesicle protein [Chlorobiales bacterium]